MPRARKQKSQAPVRVEINFDPDFEDLVEDKEMKDVRFVKVTVKDRKLQARPDIALLAAPTEGAGPLVCPLKLRGEPAYKEEGDDGVVEFRAELDVDAIVSNWQTVEQAAVKSLNQPLPFRFTVGIQKENEGDPEMLERPGELTINLNRISWSWEELVREGGKESTGEGGGLDNPIEVTLDGTDSHGFRLTLELEERKPNGQYEKRDADFTHYLSPAVHEVDTTILAPQPLPWELKPDEDKSQIETTWWTKTLPADHNIFSKLPIETTIRVRAYRYKSIKRHVNAGAPIFDGDSKQYAMREIPLHLGAKKWAATVLAPDPNDAPVLLAGVRPWEECVHAEIQLFAGNPSQAKSVEGTEVEWKFSESSKSVGTVNYEGQTKLASGTWKVNDRGSVEFVFCPEKHNALFIEKEDGVQYYADFDVRLKDKGKDKDPDKSKIASAKTPDDKTKPSFRLEWAPKFDLGLVKLPFFVDPDVPLDLESEPNEDTAKPVKLELTPADEQQYRLMFRDGGTIMLRPVVPWDTKQTDGADSDVPLQHYKLIVGLEATGEGDKRHVLAVEDQAKAAWPSTVTLKSTRPDAKGGGSTITLKPKAQLHPDIRRYLERVRDESDKLEDMMTRSKAVIATSFADGGSNFRELGKNFGDVAIHFFAETPQAELVEKRKELKLTLSGMQMFVRNTGVSWTRLGAAIELHRQGYQRFSDNMLNFYYDFLLWGRMEQAVNAVWGWLRSFKYLKNLPEGPPIFKLNYLVNKLHEVIQAAIFKAILNKTFLPGIKKVLTEAREKLSAARNALTTAEQNQNIENPFRRLAQRFSQQADEVASLTTQIEQMMEHAASSGMAKAELREALQPLVVRRAAIRADLKGTTAAMADHLRTGGSETLNRRIMAAAQLRKAQAYEQSWKDVNDHLAKTEKDVTEFIEKEIGEGEDLGQKAQELVKQCQNPAVKPSQFMPELKRDAQQAIEREVQEGIEDFNLVQSKMAVLKGQPPPPAVAVPPGVTVDTGDLDRELARLKPSLDLAPSKARDFANNTKNLVDYHLQSATQIWEAQKLILDEMLEDGVNSGAFAMTDAVREQTQNAPDPPAASPGGGGGIIEGVWNKAKALLNWLLDAFKSVAAKAFSKFITLVAWLLRIVFFFLNPVLRLTAKLGGKICEMFIHLFHKVSGPHGYVRVSALRDNALKAGLAVVDAGGGGSSEFFAFPYNREEDAISRIRTATDQWLTTDAWDTANDKAIDELLRAGYEDYYPGQLKRARGLFYNLCHRVLDKETLKSPPCQDDPGPVMVDCMSAGDSLQRQIQEYNQSASRQARLSEQGFSAPLSDLLGEGAWNLEDFDLFCDWVGWIFSWGLRLVALIVAIVSWWTGAGIALAGGLMLGAQAAAAVTGLARILVSSFGVYPFISAYPLDVVALQSVQFAAIFAPSSERFTVNSPNDIIKAA